MNGCREDRRAVECSVCKIKVKDVERVLLPFLISQSPAAWRLEAQGMRKWDRSGQRAGDSGPEWQVGMICEVLGLTLSHASLEDEAEATKYLRS